MIEAEITQAGLRLQNALVPPTPQGLHNVLGSGYREIQIPLHGGGLRRIRAFDDLGIAYYLDDTPPEVPSILFVLFPQDAPFDVARPFAGRLFINGTAITPEMTGSELPVVGAMRFEPQFGHKWRASTPKFSVWLSLRRRSNRLGRRTGAPRLTDVSICYDHAV